MNPYILTDDSLTIVLDGKALTMRNDHANWQATLEALSNEDWDALPNLFDESKAVEDYFDANAGIAVKDGAVFCTAHGQDEALHGVVVDKILHFMRNSLPYKPLVRFVGKLADNPSRRAIDELYTFLEHKSMPITPDGNFIAYKGVKQDFTDHYSGKFDNSVGQTLSMRRNQVCDDADQGCSSGFHAGSYEYAKGYTHGGGNLMRVEIDPSDVVSVPKDCDCQKLRTSKYIVVALHETIEAPLEEGIYGEWEDDDEGHEDDHGGRDDAGHEYGAGWDAGYDQAKRETRGSNN
jgi:hypothetical protein